MARAALSAVAALMLATTTYAADIPTAPPGARTLDKASLQALLADTAWTGEWRGRAYRQIFRASGRTRYTEAGAQDTFGRWWIEADGLYCSVWPPNEHRSCYTLLVDEDHLYWAVDGGFNVSYRDSLG